MWKSKCAAAKPAATDQDGFLIGWQAPADCCWQSERLAVQLADWRMNLELWLAGAILKHPRLGLLRADECGVRLELFEREDVRCMYLAARFCVLQGTSDERAPVLAVVLALHALRRGGWGDPRAVWHERGLVWSEVNLVDLACRNKGPADVIDFARQLIDLDRRQKIASRLWLRMWKVLDGFGRPKAEGRRMKDEG